MNGSQLEPRDRQSHGGDLARPPKRARNVSTSEVRHDSALVGLAGDSSISHESTKNGRQEAPPAQRVQDKDKNRRLSCKECRRLKLKCDRVFPCQSCVKRGCGSLCPEGALTSGRGSRFILANTEQLHEKILQLSDRVRQLEEALESLQSSCSNLSHPLLSPELLQIKTSQDLYSSSQSIRSHPPDTSTSQNNDRSRNIELHSPSNGSFSGDKHYPSNTEHVSFTQRPMRVESPPPEVPPDILQLSATFPFPWAVDLRIRKRIRDALPARADALAICEEARKNALWQYNLDASETFLQNLLHHCYTTSIEDLSPRRLALLLMILSIGSLVDLNRPLGSLHGEAYHHLARASVCEIPLMEEPDFDVLHALFFMIWYHLIFSDNKKAVGYAWNLMGFVAKLAQGLGLHRDGSRSSKVIPEEYEKRRAVFWELLNLDCRMSLSLGRPPSICLAHVDTKPPSYLGPGLHAPREEIIYHEWKNTFLIRCLTPILEAMVTVKPPEYSHIINLDKCVRDYDVPPLLEGYKSEHVPPRFLVMQRALVSTSRAIALLQLHRRYFTEAMSGPEEFDHQHQYAPSVVATYLGVSTLIAAVETLFDQEQQLSARFLYFWFNAFSGAVTLTLFLSRAPSSPLAPYALQDLESVCRLFRRVASILPFSGKALPVMDKLLDRSRRTYLQSHTPSSHSGENNGHQLYTRYPQLVATKPSPPSLPPSFANVHPFLSRYAEKIKFASPAPSELPHQRQPPQMSSEVDPTDTWLPDVYRFTSVGVGTEDRYTVASAQPTPFIPSSPRVSENANFNFDHGALTAELAETSYMAWF